MASGEKRRKKPLLSHHSFLATRHSHCAALDLVVARAGFFFGVSLWFSWVIGELEALEKKNKAKLEQQIKTTTGLMKNEMQRQQDLMRMQDTRSMMRSLAR